MAELGRKWGEDIPGHVRAMMEAFTALLADSPKEGVEVTRDVAYGSRNPGARIASVKVAHPLCSVAEA